MVEWNTDSDGDTIPDSSDDDHGDVIEIKSDAQKTQISVTL